MLDASVFEELEEFCDFPRLSENREWLQHALPKQKWETKKKGIAQVIVQQGWIEVGYFVSAVVEETLEQRFQEQSDKWWKEAGHFSSPGQQMMHPSYQAILGMASTDSREVISLMLRDMRNKRRPWFLALSYLTHANPIRERDAGKTDKMIKAWVEWGKAQHLL